MTELKSTDGWLKHLNIEKIAIVDPDGWCRRGPHEFQASWDELITIEEFWDRLNASTVSIKAFYKT